MAFIVKRDVIAAPTTIALGTPNIYLSGLTFPATDGQWSAFTYDNPLPWYGINAEYGWISLALSCRVSWYAGEWRIDIPGYYETGDENSGYNVRTACRKTASSTALPLYGWTNESWVTGGTIVISTTP
jgi:hypothetical protein